MGSRRAHKQRQQADGLRMTTSWRVCSVDGCVRRHYGRGLCQMHWQRWKVNGAVGPAAPLQTQRGGPQAFLAKAEMYDGNDCILWPYARSHNGYATIDIDGRRVRVSRLLCERERGPPPSPAHHAAHSCGMGHIGCVTKKHLKWLTPKQNMEERDLHGTTSRGEHQPSAKLTDRDVRTIRALRGQVRQVDLAARFGVSQFIISAIQLRKNWKHIR